MLLRAILPGEVWNGVLLSKVKKEDVPNRFCCLPDNDGHLFWDCTFHAFVELRNSPGVPSFNEQGSHELASMSSLALLATWADFSDCGYPLGHCI